MYTILVVLEIFIAIFLILSILMQSSKGGGGLAGAFGGGGGNQTAFGGRGAVDFLGKATWVLGAMFMLNSLFLAMSAGARTGGDGSLIEKSVFPPAATAPATPGQGSGVMGDSPVDTTPLQAPAGGDLDSASPAADPGAAGDAPAQEDTPSTGGN